MPQLIDSFQRRIEYVRLSVTDRCDLRCFYCLPKGHGDFQEPETWLSFDEIRRIMAVFARLGVSKLRITGGEPLARKNLPELVTALSAISGIEDISLSTNGVQLARQAAALKAAGVQRINVSLDSVNEQCFREITGGKLDKVLNGLQVAKQVGFDPIKINMVMMKGVNDGQLDEMVAFCMDNGFVLRFIETMPMGDTGRQAGIHYLGLDQVQQRLVERFNMVPSMLPGGGPARYFKVPNTESSIGFITPMSQHFCETCNRVRLSADGILHLCLGQDDAVDLRGPLRAGACDKELEDIILAGITMKPERHYFREQPEKIIRFMSRTGG